jgi:hypothetical protein
MRREMTDVRLRRENDAKGEVAFLAGGMSFVVTGFLATRRHW